MGTGRFGDFPDRESLIAHARGDLPADVLLRNARVVNVFTGEIVPGDVAIARSRIAGLSPCQAAETIDLQGAYVAPGFIDAHVHVESAMVPPAEFARAVVPRGTTSIVTDPHEIANVLGLEGIRFMFESAKHGALSMFVMAPSCVPATTMETSGAALRAHDLLPLRGDPWVLGLAEVMNFPAVISGDAHLLDKLEVFRDHVVDGHCPAVTGRALEAYVAAGVMSDHESTTAGEALEKLRLGMTIFIREGTVARNLDALLPIVTPATRDRICLCTDDVQPRDLLDCGHIDHLVRRAIAAGLDPVTAIRLATWNPAAYFRLHDRGAITPGRRADLIVFDDLQAPAPRLVFRGGHLVARDGRMTAPPPPVSGRAMRHTINVDWDRVDLRIRAEGPTVRVIGAREGSLLTDHLTRDARIAGGEAVADPERDLLKMAVVERHMASGALGRGFVAGLGLRRGAIASSVAHDHHNLVVIGADDASMMTALRGVAATHGGMAVAEGTSLRAQVPLPIGGLMSPERVEVVRDQIDEAIRAARSLGATFHDPFMAMSFLALEVIPSLKLTDQGLVDVERFAFVPLFV